LLVEEVAIISAVLFAPTYAPKRKLVGTVVPQAVAQVNRTLDPELKDARTMLDEIRSRIPGVSDSIPPRLNIWGDPITLGGGLGPDLISPIYTSRVENDPVAHEVARLKIGMSMPLRKIGDKQLTTEEYNRYVVTAGQPAKEVLRRIISQPNWASVRDTEKRQVIRGVVSAFRVAAEAKLPYLRNAKIRKQLTKIN